MGFECTRHSCGLIEAHDCPSAAYGQFQSVMRAEQCTGSRDSYQCIGTSGDASREHSVFRRRNERETTGGIRVASHPFAADVIARSIPELSGRGLSRLK